MGEGQRFATPTEYTEFVNQLKVHCRQAAVIVKDFAGGWAARGKHAYGSQNDKRKQRSCRTRMAMAGGRPVGRSRALVLAKWGAVEYWPTRREITAKCCLFRTRAGRQGAHARRPRGGEFAVVTTAGI